MAFPVLLCWERNSPAILADVAIAFSPIALLFILAAVGSPMLIGGWLFSFKEVQPKFERLNPLTGIGNIISARAGVELKGDFERLSLSVQSPTSS